MEGKRSALRKPNGFPRCYRLGGNKNYRFVYRRGKSTPSRNIVLVHLKGRDLKIGFSVSGKVGNAVTRNRSEKMDARGRAQNAPADEMRQVHLRCPSIAERGSARGGDARELHALLQRAKLLREDGMTCAACPQRIMLALIRFYRRNISPRHVPCCQVYSDVLAICASGH